MSELSSVHVLIVITIGTLDRSMDNAHMFHSRIRRFQIPSLSLIISATLGYKDEIDMGKLRSPVRTVATMRQQLSSGGSPFQIDGGRYYDMGINVHVPSSDFYTCLQST